MNRGPLRSEQAVVTGAAADECPNVMPEACRLQGDDIPVWREVKIDAGCVPFRLVLF